MKPFPRTPIIVAFAVILFNVVLAYAQTNTNSVPAPPTEVTPNNLMTLAVGAFIAVSALVAGIVAYLKKKKPPAA